MTSAFGGQHSIQLSYGCTRKVVFTRYRDGRKGQNNTQASCCSASSILTASCGRAIAGSA